MASLDGVKLKIVRAEEHLRFLDQEIGRYLESDPFEFVKELDGKDICIVLRIKRQPDPYLSTIIGDCLHNLRSSLDHLLWQLLIWPLPPKVNPKQLSFPIFIDEGKYGDALNKNGLPRCVTESALAIIERLQPYHARENAQWHALWFIHELSNRDKHVMLHITVGKARSEEVRITGAIPGKTSHEISSAMLDHGTVLVRLPVSELGENPMNVNASIAGFVTLKEPDPWTDEAISVYLARSLDFLKRRLVPCFEPLFGEGS